MNTKNIRFRTAAAGHCLAIAALAPVAAQANAPSVANAELEEVVVTASRVEERLLDTSASLSVLTSLELSRMMASGVADYLRDVPGLQVSDSGQAGLKRIRIRGEDSRRNAILVDSHELADHSEVGAPLTIHPYMISRIEVLRGSGSVLYGSKALSGVTNLMTLKGGTKPLQATLKASYDGSTGGDNYFASVHGNQSGWSYRLAAADSDHGLRRTPDGDADNTAFDNSGYYGFLEKTAGDHTIAFTWDNYESSSDIFVEESVRTTFPITDLALSTPQRDRERFAVDYTWEPGAFALDRLLVTGFTQDSDRHFITNTATVFFLRDIDTQSTLKSEGLLVQADWMPLGDHRLITGLQYSDDDVDQGRQVDTLAFSPAFASGSQRIEDDASIRTLALFVQDRWELSDRITASIGARYYQVDGDLDATDREGLTAGSLDSDSHVIASAGLSWELDSGSVLRANVSEGYLYPSLMQLATGAYAGSDFINPRSDLTPETSINYELGWRHMGSAWTVDTALFYSDSDDYIDHLFCRETDPCLTPEDKIYRNVGSSTAYGMELYLAWQDQSRQWRPYLNVTWMRRNNDFGEVDTWKSGIPALAGRAGLMLEPRLSGLFSTLWADLYVRGETQSTEFEPGARGSGETRRDSWSTLNLALGLSLAENVSASIEVQNLADHSYREASENLLAPGRNASVKLTWDIN